MECFDCAHTERYFLFGYLCDLPSFCKGCCCTSCLKLPDTSGFAELDDKADDEEQDLALQHLTMRPMTKSRIWVF